MSGHEKFYIPHDDLQELKTAIESLETEIEALDADIETLTTAFLLPSSETSTSANELNATSTDVEILIDEPLSATLRTFIRRATVYISAGSSDPLIDHTSDILVVIGTADRVALGEVVFGDNNRFMKDAAGDYYYYRSWTINDFLLEAGEDITAAVHWCNIETSTRVYLYIEYRTATLEPS